MKSIFLLTNFSGASKKAIQEFLDVYLPASYEPIKYVLLNTWDQQRTGHFQMINLEEHLETNSAMDLKMQRSDLIKHLPEIEPNLVIESRKGDVCQIVNLMSERVPPELVVIGSKGSNVLREILISTTGRIIRQVHAPVLVIPESTPFRYPNRIVFATDMQECKNVEDFIRLANIVRLFRSEFILLHIYKKDKPEEKAFEECMQKHLEGINHAFYYEQNLNVAEGITEFCQNMQAGILAMVLHDSSLLANLFKHNTTRRVAQKSTIPLLIIHDQN